MNRPMRRQKCEVTDPVKIEQIIKKAGVVHLGMVDESGSDNEINECEK